MYLYTPRNIWIRKMKNIEYLKRKLTKILKILKTQKTYFSIFVQCYNFPYYLDVGNPMPRAEHQIESVTCAVCGTCHYLRQAHDCHGNHGILSYSRSGSLGVSQDNQPTNPGHHHKLGHGESVPER